MIAYVHQSFPSLAPVATDIFRQSLIRTARGFRHRGRRLAFNVALGAGRRRGESGANRRCGDVAAQHLDRREHSPIAGNF